MATMASMLARRARLSRLSRSGQFCCRSFTRSAPTLKKRAATSSVDADDLFAPSDDDDLFPSSSGRSDTSSSSKSTTSAFQRPFAKKSSKSRSAKVKSSFEQFDEHYAFVMDRLGLNPVALHPQVRNSAIRRLLHHSRGSEHLDRIAEVLVKWRNNGRVIDKQTATEIIDRCLARNPPLLLTLLADMPKYGVTLPNMTDARRILRRLIFYRPHPLAQSTDIKAKKKANAEALKNAATFAALLPAHGLRKATEDMVCCALLAHACARNLLFAETLSAKQEKQSEEEGGTGKEAVKRTPLRAASTRGLLSISSMLASLLSRVPIPDISPDLSASPPSLRLPTPEYVSTLAMKYETTPGAKHGTCYFKQPEVGFDTIEEGMASRPTDCEKRMSGVTQTGLEARSWALVAVRDVIRALRLVENPNKKPILETLEKVSEDALTEEDADQVPVATSWVEPRVR